MLVEYGWLPGIKTHGDSDLQQCVARQTSVVTRGQHHIGAAQFEVPETDNASYRFTSAA